MHSEGWFRGPALVEEGRAGSEASTSSLLDLSEGSFIQHKVSRTDTLAGLAVRYNVTVWDIKRANGLVAESGLFARGSIQIPVAAGAASADGSGASGSGALRHASASRSRSSLGGSPLPRRGPSAPGSPMMSALGAVRWSEDDDDDDTRSHYSRRSDRSTPGDVELVDLQAGTIGAEFSAEGGAGGSFSGADRVRRRARAAAAAGEGSADHGSGSGSPRLAAGSGGAWGAAAAGDGRRHYVPSPIKGFASGGGGGAPGSLAAAQHAARLQARDLSPDPAGKLKRTASQPALRGLGGGGMLGGGGGSGTGTPTGAGAPRPPALRAPSVGALAGRMLSWGSGLDLAARARTSPVPVGGGKATAAAGPAAAGAGGGVKGQLTPLPNKRGAGKND